MQQITWPQNDDSLRCHTTNLCELLQWLQWCSLLSLKKEKKKLTARALDIYDYLYVVRCSRAQLGAHAHVCFFHSTLISTKCYQDSGATSTRSAFLTEYSYNRYQWLIQQQWKHAKHSAWKSKVGNCAEGRTLTKAHENTGKGYECPYKLSKVCSHPIHTHTCTPARSHTHITSTQNPISRHHHNQKKSQLVRLAAAAATTPRSPSSASRSPEGHGTHPIGQA